jgi:hypothetical protein
MQERPDAIVSAFWSLHEGREGIPCCPEIRM